MDIFAIAKQQENKKKEEGKQADRKQHEISKIESRKEDEKQKAEEVTTRDDEDAGLNEQQKTMKVVVRKMDFSCCE